MQLNNTAAEIVCGIFLFNGIDRADAESLLEMSGMETKSYKSGEVIYEPDSFSRSLGVMLSGSAGVTTVGGSKKVVLRNLVKSDVFGAASLFGGEEYVTVIRAKTAVTAAFIGQEAVERIITTDSRASINYIRFLSDRIRFLNRKIACFTAGCADSSVALYLLNLERNSDGSVMMPAAYKPLADMLGIGRASLYRALDSLEAAGAIVRNGRSITIISNDKLLETASQKEPL